jgi:hypothetical protein
MVHLRHLRRQRWRLLAATNEQQYQEQLQRAYGSGSQPCRRLTEDYEDDLIWNLDTAFQPIVQFVDRPTSTTDFVDANDDAESMDDDSESQDSWVEDRKPLSADGRPSRPQALLPEPSPSQMLVPKIERRRK